ncbi:hypothetical protein D3C83_274570 [compost metagenome]
MVAEFRRIGMNGIAEIIAGQLVAESVEQADAENAIRPFAAVELFGDFARIIP